MAELCFCYSDLVSISFRTNFLIKLIQYFVLYTRINNNRDISRNHSDYFKLKSSISIETRNSR